MWPDFCHIRAFTPRVLGGVLSTRIATLAGWRIPDCDHFPEHPEAAQKHRRHRKDHRSEGYRRPDEVLVIDMKAEDVHLHAHIRIVEIVPAAGDQQQGAGKSGDEQREAAKTCGY